MTQPRTNPLAMYDITASAETYSLETLFGYMTKYCKRWCFQLEQGEISGYRHYQCRVSLIKKKRVNEMITHILTHLPGGAHVSPTSNPTFYTGDEFYVMKLDTRIDGPWSDRTYINENDFPVRLRGQPTWRPWQQSVINTVQQEPDDRLVHIIVDEHGNSGKSFLTMWLSIRNIGERIPQQRDSRDIMRMVMDMPKRKVYFIDLPRSAVNRDQSSVYAAIEEIKNGFAFDDRYHYRRTFFEPPHVFVFTNQRPGRDLLTRDRWVYWTIDQDQQLVPFNFNAIPIHRDMRSVYNDWLNNRQNAS